MWKFEDAIDNLQHNVITSSWFPQRDILGTLGLIYDSPSAPSLQGLLLIDIRIPVQNIRT